MWTKEKKTKITNIRNERGNITTDPMDFKGQYRNTINNSVPTNLITRWQRPIPWRTSAQTNTRKNNPNRPMSIEEIESIINILPKQSTQPQVG